MVTAIDASTPWGTPTIPTTEPGLAMANAVATDCPVPTHSRAASTPTPFVSSLRASIAASPRAAVRARAVAIDEGRDDEIALRNAPHLATDLFHHADELVADRAEIVGRLAAVVPEIRTADT